MVSWQKAWLQALLCALLLFVAFMPAARGANAQQGGLAPAWAGLAKRLAADGIQGPEVNALLATLPSTPVQAPMGRKIQELYRLKFVPGARKKVSSTTFYKGVVSEANALKCRQYIGEHQQAFNDAFERYGVSPAIASALLFVETRLGKVLADVPENAFYILASMAVSNTAANISDWLPKMPGYAKHMDWLDETLRKRSSWAYNETRALVRHMLRDHIPPSRLPSSIYGAVGLCQFMPSNISTYGADGDRDGIVDLFNPPDAIASLANYLAKHGWKKGLPQTEQHRLLMTYNHSKVYANTILALAALIQKGKASPAGKNG